jgi:hypothetical protein
MSLIRTAALCGMFAVIPALSGAEALAPVALNSFSAPPAQAASAKVLDQNGRLLGQVERIQADQDGKPSALAFRAAKDGSTVVISAAAVSYDGKVLVAGNDQPQIAALIRPQLRTAVAE